MAALNWTKEAERWLEDIHDYIAEDNPEAAAQVVSSIYKKAQLLRRFPKMGYRYTEEGGQSIRILLHGHYRIAYLVKADGSIDVLGVFHGALDIDRYLF